MNAYDMQKSDFTKWEHEIKCPLCRIAYALKRYGRMVYHQFANSGLAMMGQPPVRWDD